MTGLAWSAAQVYPRVCGGTPANPALPWLVTGLSPRVRGNPPFPAPAPPLYSSIPACAGEPDVLDLAGGGEGLYPRVCGGTPLDSNPRLPVRGLSPRVRGNRPPTPARHGGIGSIPACAGEPSSASTIPCAMAVYPRVCGGTVALQAVVERRLGLSPRVRGNRQQWRRRAYDAGSIPACAGEPTTSAGALPSASVYPRVCGGTAVSPPSAPHSHGLSPRVRGNQVYAAGG